MDVPAKGQRLSGGQKHRQRCVICLRPWTQQTASREMKPFIRDFHLHIVQSDYLMASVVALPGMPLREITSV